jgi:hypothetical protein
MRGMVDLQPARRLDDGKQMPYTDTSCSGLLSFISVSFLSSPSLPYLPWSPVQLFPPEKSPDRVLLQRHPTWPAAIDTTTNHRRHG